MLPLLPPAESQPRWRAFDSTLAALGRRSRTSINRHRRHLPIAARPRRRLRAPGPRLRRQQRRAGPPWLYEGKIAVTTGGPEPVQEPLPRGKVGMSVPEDCRQVPRRPGTLPPAHAGKLRSRLHVNLDFRIGPSPRQAARPTIASGSVHFPTSPASRAAHLRDRGFARAVRRPARTPRHVPRRKPGATCNWLSTCKRGTVSGRVGTPGAREHVFGQAMSRPAGPAGLTQSRSHAVSQRGSDDREPDPDRLPPAEFDNLGVQEPPIPPVSAAPPAAQTETRSRPGRTPARLRRRPVSDDLRRGRGQAARCPRPDARRPDRPGRRRAARVYQSAGRPAGAARHVRQRPARAGRTG